MIKVGLGQSESIDTRKAVQAVIAECKSQLQAYAPQAGIVFSGVNFDHQQMLDEINRSFPKMEIIGCTTAGEFSTDHGFSDDSIILMTFYSDDVEIKPGIGGGLSKDPAAAVKSAVGQAREKLSQKPRLCLAFPDGYNKSFDATMDMLNKHLGDDCQVFGGAAGTQWSESRQILQFYNDRIFEDSIPILLWAGPFEYSFSIANSWKPIGKKTIVTDSEGRRVRKIGDFKAVDFYRYYLGNHSEPAREFVLAVYDEGRERSYLRAPIAYEPDGSIIFSESIPRGATVQLTEAIRENIIADTKVTTEGLTLEDPLFQPSFALAFSCDFRKEVLGTRTGEELQIIRQNLPRNIPISGFYSYGEIAPLARGQKSLFHGATLVTLLVGQLNGEPERIEQDPPQPTQGSDYSDQSQEPVDDRQLLQKLKLENEFLKRKLNRSENYRSRMEEIKDFTAAMHHKIIQEVEDARREIQRQEAALRESEVKYRRIVETTGEGFILMDENLNIIDVNDAYCQMVNYSRDKLLGKSPLDLASAESRQFLLMNREELLSKSYREFECVIIAKDGRQIPILVHGNTLKDDHGQIIGNMAFVTDMTEHKKALALAGEVQKSMLPRIKPQIPGFDVAGRNVSCDEIGGDYFDYFWRRQSPKEPFSIVVGDISGHGVDSALLMTSARAFLRMRASQPGSISEVVTAMNQHLTRDVLESGRFMTLFYMSIDPKEDCIEWVRAGHDPAILYDPQRDEFEELRGPGVALGVDNDFKFKASQKKGLSDGHVIAIGTDGIWEAFNKEGHMFGKERFREIIRQNADTDADSILNAVYSQLRDYTRGQKSEDDITLVIIKINKAGIS